MESKYLVLLYYHFTPIDDPELLREQQHLFCLNQRLWGRIIVAPEGLNGSVSGTEEDCISYMDYVRSDTRFVNIDFKVEKVDTPSFEKLHVRVKPEIVNAGLPHIKPWQQTGKHLEPAEFKKIKDDEDVVIVDFRSTYEHNIGKFHNAVTLDIENFREFPEKMEKLEEYKTKRVITYCTGGIKCEKASSYLLEMGFENVYQLHGGIIKYALEEGGEDFEGKCYVFDNRVVVDVNRVNPKVISNCYICRQPCDRMVNCANPICNNHVPICESCGWEMLGACSDPCKKHSEKREYNGSGYYQKESNGYNPYIGFNRRKNDDESEKLSQTLE